MLHFTYTLGIHAENIGKVLQGSGIHDKCSMSFSASYRMQSVHIVWRCWLLARWCGKEGRRNLTHNVGLAFRVAILRLELDYVTLRLL